MPHEDSLRSTAPLNQWRIDFFAAAVFGVFIFALLPAGIVALNDDFGYLRSVVLTIQHGRPWTDDWLEPWSAGFSGLAALLFKVTGSFYFATYGFLAGLGCFAFFALCRLLRSRGLAGGPAMALAALALTFPTVLWKSLEFTGVALYIPSLLVALWLAETRRWGWFLLVWALALSTRQSAITWAVLPVAAAAEDLVRLRGKLRLKQWATFGGVPLIGICLYMWLGHAMNKTHAQRLITDQMWTHLSFASSRGPLLVGGSIALLITGLAGLVFRLSGAGAVQPQYKPRLLWIRVALAVTVLALLSVGAHDFIGYDHAAFDEATGRHYLKIITCLAAVGLLVGRFSFNPIAAGGVVAAWAALSLRGMIWDYYLCDLAAFAFFTIAPLGRWSSTKSYRGVRWWCGAGTLGALALFHLCFVGHFKMRVDRGHAMCALGSQALSSGLLRPDEPSVLPFGLQGWYYFPYYITHEGATGGDPADFGRYLKQDTVDVAWRFAKPLRFLPEHGGGWPLDRSPTILSGRFPYFWIFIEDVLFLHAPPERTKPARSPLPPDFRLPVFPRDDRGWRELIESGRI